MTHTTKYDQLMQVHDLRRPKGEDYLKEVLAKLDSLEDKVSKLTVAIDEMSNIIAFWKATGDNIADIDILDLKLSTRAHNALTGCGVRTAKQLLNMKVSDIAMLPNVGIGTMQNIKDAVENIGLRFRNR